VDVRGGPQGHMKFVVARRSLLPTTPHPPNLRVLPPHRFCPRSTQHRLAAATSAGTVVTALRRSRCHRQLRTAPSPPACFNPHPVRPLPFPSSCGSPCYNIRLPRAHTPLPPPPDSRYRLCPPHGTRLHCSTNHAVFAIASFGSRSKFKLISCF